MEDPIFMLFFFLASLWRWTVLGSYESGDFFDSSNFCRASCDMLMQYSLGLDALRGLWWRPGSHDPRLTY